MNRVLQPFAYTRTHTAWPYVAVVLAIVLVALWCLDDEERRASLLDRDDQLRAAQLVNLAMWDATRLDGEIRRHLGELQQSPDDAATNDTIIAAAHEYLLLAKPKA